MCCRLLTALVGIIDKPSTSHTTTDTSQVPVSSGAANAMHGMAASTTASVVFKQAKSGNAGKAADQAGPDTYMQQQQQLRAQACCAAVLYMACHLASGATSSHAEVFGQGRLLNQTNDCLCYHVQQCDHSRTTFASCIHTALCLHFVTIASCLSCTRHMWLRPPR